MKNGVYQDGQGGETAKFKQLFVGVITASLICRVSGNVNQTSSYQSLGHQYCSGPAGAMNPLPGGSSDTSLQNCEDACSASTTCNFISFDPRPESERWGGSSGTNRCHLCAGSEWTQSPHAWLVMYRKSLPELAFVTQQGACRGAGDEYGGYCRCGVQASAAACFALGGGGSLAEFQANATCNVMYLSKSAPTNCDAACIPVVGTSTITAYAADASSMGLYSSRLCLFPPDAAFVPHRGACRGVGDEYGGYCFCGVQASAAACFALAGEGNTAEFKADGICNVMYLSKSAPTDCAAGCTSLEGLSTVAAYVASLGRSRRGQSYSTYTCLFPPAPTTSALLPLRPGEAFMCSMLGRGYSQAQKELPITLSGDTMQEKAHQCYSLAIQFSECTCGRVIVYPDYPSCYCATMTDCDSGLRSNNYGTEVYTCQMTTTTTSALSMETKMLTTITATTLSMTPPLTTMRVSVEKEAAEPAAATTTSASSILGVPSTTPLTTMQVSLEQPSGARLFVHVGLVVPIAFVIMWL